MIYRYETHMHTFPVSQCAKVGVRESLEYYKSLGYDGVFITNHFLGGNINLEHRTGSYEDRVHFYFSDYEEGARIADEVGIRVFPGVELTGEEGTDYLIYGLDKQWYLDHPEIEHMKATQKLSLLMQSGALVVQAHPYREANYIDHIRLFPRSVHGVEVINALSKDFENDMARHYADAYGLLHFAGSDNHRASGQRRLAGMCAQTPIKDAADFAERVLKNEMSVFVLDADNP